MSKSKKQAILLIHGMGEQRPMSTASNFVSAIAGNKNFYYSPSNYGLSGEVCKISIPRSRNKPATDIYEYYWAHEFRDNKLSTIHNWLFQVAIQCGKKQLGRRRNTTRNQHTFPSTKENLVLLIGVLYVIALITLFALTIHVADTLKPLVITVIVGFVVYKLLLSNILLGYLADAAKYLSSHPDNISARERVRSGAIKLLRDLNESDDYDRVLIVGHSLGSVIGSDALTQYWHEVCDQALLHDEGRDAVKQRCDELLQMTPSLLEPIFISQFQKQQRLLREALFQSGCSWKISDLITVGSPLSFANFLLAANDQDFHRKTIETQQIPVCPPSSKIRNYLYLGPAVGNPPRSSWYPVASTVFLYTRWTNLYGTKDLFGGPIAPLYGYGVFDIKVQSSGFLSAHTEYFSGKNDRISNQLRSALKLETGHHTA